MFVLILAIATGVGAYGGSLMGALSMTRTGKLDPRTGEVRMRHAGVLLAAHVSPDNTALVANELRQGGAEDVERAEGQWRDGRWEDFDPLAPPVPAGQLTGDPAARAAAGVGAARFFSPMSFHPFTRGAAMQRIDNSP